ncbi:hypothetical protein C1646_755101 [Rhizophagus diaphanus]|nr:hypothetical protein C1646_755101 [Rhizophagus diaphanus] [Rhizophagus sp. MUCL 43196]
MQERKSFDEEPEISEEESYDEIEEEEEDEEYRYDWMHLAEMGSNVRIQSDTDLGTQAIDRNHNWTNDAQHHYSEESIANASDFVRQAASNNNNIIISGRDNGIEAIREQLNTLSGKDGSSPVLVIAPTGIEASLVNGSMGVVEDLLFQEEGPPALPTAVFIKFDKYDGPTITSLEGKEVVPIVPIKRSWEDKNGTTCSRTQLPICLAWSITAHKSQGLTLEKFSFDRI